MRRFLTLTVVLFTGSVKNLSDSTLEDMQQYWRTIKTKSERRILLEDINSKSENQRKALDVAITHAQMIVGITTVLITLSIGVRAASNTSRTSQWILMTGIVAAATAMAIAMTIIFTKKSRAEDEFTPKAMAKRAAARSELDEAGQLWEEFVRDSNLLHRRDTNLQVIRSALRVSGIILLAGLAIIITGIGLR